MKRRGQQRQGLTTARSALTRTDDRRKWERTAPTLRKVLPNLDTCDASSHSSSVRSSFPSLCAAARFYPSSLAALHAPSPGPPPPSVFTIPSLPLLNVPPSPD